MTPVYHTLLTLVAVWWVKKATSPSEATVIILDNIQTVQKEMQSEHKRMQEVNAQLLVKVAEINVWKDGHEDMDKTFHKAMIKKLDRIEGV